MLNPIRCLQLRNPGGSDLVIKALPIYIQEKVHPKALSDDQNLTTLTLQQARWFFGPSSGVGHRGAVVFHEFVESGDDLGGDGSGFAGAD